MRTFFGAFARKTSKDDTREQSFAAPSKHAHAPKGETVWPYSKSYVDIVDEGHQRPPPSFGTPTLAWHVGIWPTLKGGELDKRTLDFTLSKQRRIDIYEENNRKFFGEISRILDELQERGRVLGTTMHRLIVSKPSLAASEVHAFEACDPQSLSFTLWWQDAAGKGARNIAQRAPSTSDLRVRVQVQTHLDHATISFFIDAGKPWNASRVQTARDAVGDRRKAILEHIEAVTAICRRQIAGGQIDLDRIPEAGISAPEAQKLFDAASYCYTQIWDEFSAAFGFDALVSPDVDRDSRVGEVFASIRSLVASTEGIPTPGAERRAADTAALRQKAGLAPAHPGATTGIGLFDTFDEPSGEANTVLKSYWPFIRRMTPGADDRDFIACGVFDWRALFVSSLGSRVERRERDEADDPDGIVPAKAVPNVDSSERAQLAPVQQLFLTKGEPHRQQIGRIVERANAVGTMRLYALRNWTTIRNAGIHIRLAGERLDSILSHWSQGRSKINGTFKPTLRTHRTRDTTSSVSGKVDRKKESEDQLVIDSRTQALSDLIRETESRLIQLGADLDSIGQGGSGRLLYVINRAKRYVQEFQRLMSTMKISNIPTWTTYEQFVDRGLAPTFEAIGGTGERLVSLRDRLQSVTNMVQTGALIVQTEATQHNTQTLRRVASNLTAAPFGLVGIAAGFLVSMLGDKVDLQNLINKLCQPRSWNANEWVFVGLAVYFALVLMLALYGWIRSK
ncbi:MAG: hypothetical protein K8S25_06845 [Alphaproteobacteria bacterium]|nr:hypothetical protein [Alphaproteobacteria bacterium]